MDMQCKCVVALSRIIAVSIGMIMDPAHLWSVLLHAHLWSVLLHAHLWSVGTGSVGLMYASAIAVGNLCHVDVRVPVWLPRTIRIAGL
jgi:hypothetical protein